MDEDDKSIPEPSEFFETVQEVLNYCRTKNIKISDFQAAVDRTKAVARSRKESVDAVGVKKIMCHQLKQICLQVCRTTEEVQRERDETGEDLLQKNQAQEELIKNFVELKQRFDGLVASQFCRYTQEAQVRAMKQRMEKSDKKDDKQENILRAKIGETEAARQSLIQEVERRKKGVKDMEKKLGKLKESMSSACSSLSDDGSFSSCDE